MSTIRKRGLGIFLCTLLLQYSCSNLPEEVQTAYDLAGDNKKEIDAVIEHYKKTGDDEKIKAVYFLLGNMTEKHSVDGPEVRNFDVLFDILDSVRQKGRYIPNNSPLVRHVWDSLVQVYGKPALINNFQIPDVRHIQSGYLIENIDLAFKAWNGNPHTRNIPFHDFCEYVLPHRTGTERTENWRSYLYGKYNLFRDTVKAGSVTEYTSKLNLTLAKSISTNHTLWSYPFDMPASIMEKGGRGACKHLVAYTSMVARANGLPVAMDAVNLWGNHNNGHEWNVLVMNGESHPFDPGKAQIGAKDMFVYKFAKVFRISYSRQNINLPDNTKDVPASLLNAYQIDVTSDYTKAYTITIPLTYPFETKKKYAVICTFKNNNWAPQTWGQVADNTATFGTMGADVLYIVMYYHKGIYHRASDPFVLTKEGTVNYIRPGGNHQTMILKRKYPAFIQTQTFMKSMVGVRFQGANRADFKDSVNLFTVHEIPEGYVEVSLDNTKKFRYVRYISPYRKNATIAELEFYDKGDKRLQGKVLGAPITNTEFPMQNAYDGDPATYFWGKQGQFGWTGLDLGRAITVGKIRYCPRSDTNFILIGDTYELYYWHEGRWAAVGKQAATKQAVEFNNVPAGGLYLLKDLTKGKEHRIFTYHNGVQTWF